MVLRKFMLVAMVTFIFGCKGDNDDIIKDDDVTNIDLSEGIIFGSINPNDGSETVVYKYTNEGLFLVTNSGAVSTDVVWLTGECPYESESLSANLAEGVPNVARGIRDIESTDIQDALNLNLKFYVLEYVTSGITKTIQFDDEDSFIEDQINEYFSYLKSTIPLIQDNGEVPQTSCDLTDDNAL